MAVLVCENLNKFKKGQEVIKNFSYNFLENNTYAILGRSDSNKDLLLEMLAGKVIPTSGKIYLDGEDIFKSSHLNERICLIDNNFSFSQFLKVSEVFTIMEMIFPKWDNGYAVKLLEKFEISYSIAFGKLQRNKKSLILGIIGLCSKANVTIFDNPVAYSDSTERFLFFEELYSHRLKYPRIIILTTEFIDEIDFLVDKLLLIDKGVLIDVFTVEELKENFCYLIGKTEVLSSLITNIKIIGYEEHDNTLTVCLRQKLTKDDVRKYQKYLIKISEVPIQKIFIYLLNIRDKKEEIIWTY